MCYLICNSYLELGGSISTFNMGVMSVSHDAVAVLCVSSNQLACCSPALMSVSHDAVASE